MSKQAAPSIQAYSIVPEKEDETIPSITVVGTAVEENLPTQFPVPPACSNTPVAQGLSWKDDFFEDEDDVVAVFDFDYENLENHYRNQGWGWVGITAVCCPNSIPWMLLGCIPCVLNRNVTWFVRAKHMAVKQSGIMFVHDERPTCWGEGYCTASKTTKFVPFEEITECEIVEGNSKACCISSGLSRVSILTAHSPHHKLDVFGLENPEAFRKLIMALKSGRHSMANTTSRLAMVMEGRIGNATNSGDDVASVLRDIRDELRVNNEALRSFATQPRADTVVEPSAPMM